MALADKSTSQDLVTGEAKVIEAAFFVGLIVYLGLWALTRDIRSCFNRIAKAIEKLEAQK